MSRETVVITGGGTGGHLSVARAFLEEFHKRDIDVVFIGSTYGQDKLWFENESKLKDAIFLETTGVVNKGFFGKFVALFKIIKGVKKVLDTFKKYNITKVISVGGFSAAAASFGSFLGKKELYIHEQNAHIGKLNQLSSKYAKEFFSSYHDISKVKDYPINSEFFKNSRIKTKIDSVIFLGGSQGAQAINEFAIKVAPILAKMDIKIIHQTGKTQFSDIKKRYKDLGIESEVFDFSKDILSKMAKADFAVSRSGASTLWELVALGTPTLFIPYPYAAGDHQYHNAKFIEDKKLGYILKQDELTKEMFLEILENIQLEDKSKKLQQMISPDGVKSMVDLILN